MDLTVRIGNAGDAPIQSGVPVTCYDGEPGNWGSPIGTAITSQILEPGQYEDLTLQWPDPAAGITIIYAQADDDGTGIGLISETEEVNNLVFAEMAVCTSLPTTDGISGQTIDAQTGAFLSGVTVYLHVDDNGIPGAVVGQTDSDSYGGFSFSQIDPGTYFMVSSQQGYIEGQRRVVLASDETLNHQDMVLSPILNPGEFRIVLTWGENPADLEAHLTAPNPDGCRHHCFYWDKSIPGASLDVDDPQSYGPETITISQLETGTYRFYVHDFTNRLSGSSSALSTSGATVTVYSGDGGAPMVLNVPAGTGTVWHVFNLDGASGDITPIDIMTHQDQPGQIDFPRITSSPVASATYKETYVYQIEAEDPDQDTLTYNLVKGPAGMQLDPFSGLIQWTPTAGQGQWQDVEVRVNDGRCGEDTQTFRIFLTYLPVVKFEVTPCSGMNPGGEITLTWQTERADTVTIDQGIGEVATSGSLSIPSPDQPTAYTLTATNGAGQTQRTVPKLPLISSLSASCVSSPGETATLTWGTIGAVVCHFDQGIGSVPANGSVTVTPTQLPQYFTLTCANAGGGAFEEMSLTRCRSTAELTENTDCSWSLGDPVTLEWSTTDVNECSIDPEVGSIPLNGSIEVWPSKLPARYKLSCNGASDYVFIKNPQTVELSTSSDALLPGQSTSLFWKTTCVDTCSFDQGIGDVATGGNVTVTPSQLPTTYTLTATCVNGTSLTKSVTIGMLKPTAIFSASPAMLKPGEPATLSWTTERATSCNIQPDIGDVPLNGSIAVSPDQNTTYTLTAIGPGGSTTRNAAVNFIKPTVTIYADPATLDTVGQTTILTWVFSNADTCIIDHGIGEVQLGGSIAVSPTRTTIYKITATGPGGVATSNMTVAYPSPMVTFSADRETIDEGETATLTWSSSNVDTCTIDKGVGDVSLAGSVVVDPAKTTTYTITATGPGGTIKSMVTLTCLLPTASIQADPATIVEGQAATLHWQMAHAATMVMEPIFGQVASDGSVSVTPALTTTYTITASGRGGTASAETTVTVINPPSITLIEPDGIEDNANASFTVRWTDRDPDSDAVIALYYDINNSGADGMLIVGGLAENADGLDDQYVWDTSDIPAGDYYVYAMIDDGVNTPVVDYSDGPITIDHAVTDEIKLTAGDGAAYDSFGGAVSIDGDYAVVGASDHASGGAAYIYRHEGSAWSEQLKLTAGGGASSGHFGKAVSIGGDTVVVGAPDENESQGAVYMFTNDGSIWMQKARLTADDGQPWENFGVCVAVSNDTLVVGAPDHNGGAGAAYVFTREGSSWGSPVKLTAGNGDGDGRFGASVSISNDVLMVGSPSAANGTGAAYVFRRTGTDWIEESRLTASDARDWGRFGHAVSISGDYAIVGNIGMSEMMIESAAYIFRYDGTAWIEQAKIGASDVDAGEKFAASVSINGSMAAVGELHSWESGAVYLFTRTGDQWIGQETPVPGEGESEGEGGEFPEEPNPSNAFQKLTPSDGEAGDYFGAWVALDGDHVITGACFDDDRGYDSGSAYIYPLLSVDISANPETVYLSGGGPATTTLFWTSRGIDSVTIDRDIGAVESGGSLSIAPQQTTTYTITGTKGATSVTDSITVTVIDPTALPTVTISATPETIARGESATLSWSATNVVTAVLDNAIGTVPMSGNLSVSPMETTTYTVTAANEQGTRTASVTITVTDPLPMVHLTVEPAQILTGDSVTLIWNTTYADTLSIDQDLGTVEPNGTMTVFPLQTTTYTITATGSGGTATAITAVTVTHPITLQVTEPLNGTVISDTAATVRGTIAHANGLETGLRVNGMPAIIDGDQFTANHVPLVQGENILTATATDASGLTLSDSITVDADIPEDYIRLTASPVSGTSPFETTLIIDSSFAIASTQIAYFGPGEVDYLEQTVDEMRLQVTTEGVYTFEVEATDSEGNVYTDEVSVHVVDKAALDALLQDKWLKMKTALMTGDVQRALEYHHENQRERYAAIYNAIGSDLENLAGQMQDISWICYVNGLAKYRIRQNHEISGQVVTITYYIYFSRDENGLWLIERY